MNNVTNAIMYIFAFICAVSSFNLIQPVAQAFASNDYIAVVRLLVVSFALITSFDYWWGRAESN